MLLCHVCYDFWTGVDFSYRAGLDGDWVIRVGRGALFTTNMLLGLCAMHFGGGEGSRAGRLFVGCVVGNVSNWLYSTYQVSKACKRVLYTYNCAVDLSRVVSQTEVEEQRNTDWEDCARKSWRH